MHGHETIPKWLTDLFGWFGLGSVVLLFGIVAFLSGALPIPIGYERGKIKWVMWCGTGMHAHIVYWHGEDQGRTDWAGFQSIHPNDLSEEST